MKVSDLSIADIKLLEPDVFEDDRGFFLESYNLAKFNKAIKRDIVFVQDNHSKSKRGTLRGLHFQENPMAQAKLVRVISGVVFDVAVDIRQQSNTFGQWVGEILTAENKKQLWIPEGFAHGFLTLSDEAEFLYKTSNFYSAHHEKCIIWSDNDIGIPWHDYMDLKKINCSLKDSRGVSLNSIR